MKSIRKLQQGVFLGVGKIDFSAEDLAAQAPAELLQHPEYLQLRKPGRQAEWLASRLLVQELLGLLTNQKIKFEKNEFGKPVFADARYCLSLSHSGNYIAAIVAEKQEVGIDIELISPKPKMLARKFLSERELKDAADSETKTAVYWSAKETLYKIYGQKKLLFIENLPLEPFVLESSGKINGRVQTENFCKNYCVFYEQTADFVLTWCTAGQSI